MLLLKDSKDEPPDWVNKVTKRMEVDFSKDEGAACWDNYIGKMIHTANSGRIYVEQLHLHPVRLGLTFTQEWTDTSASSDTVMVFQFIRGMVSCSWLPVLSDYRLIFTHSTFSYSTGFHCERSTGLYILCRGPRV